MKSKNLKVILVVEAVLLVCLCIGFAAGAFYYLGSQPTAGGDSQPVADATATPIPTEAPAVVETPTETPTPGPSGTTLERLADGSTKFTDYDGRYELTFPAGWLLVRPGSQEFQDALNQEGAKNPDLRTALENAQDFDPNLERVLAYDLKKGSGKTGLAGYIVVRWDQSDEVGIDEELQLSVRRLEADPENQKNGLRIVSTDKIETSNQIEVGRIGTKWSITADTGELVYIYMPVNFFKVYKGMVLLMLTTPNDLRSEVEPDFATIIDMAKLLGQ